MRGISIIAAGVAAVARPLQLEQRAVGRRMAHPHVALVVEGGEGLLALGDVDADDGARL
jgi:hypothetical protein